MRSRYRVYEPSATYFVTSTTIAWLPVFTSAIRCNILIESFEYCRAHKGLKIYGWVILDNHFHAVLSAPDLSQVLADFKRHTAQRILEQITKEPCDWLLNQFEYFRAKYKTESRHQFWQEGFHPQEIDSDEVMLQKLDYMHNNPVVRGLVAGPEHWRYSSAHEFLAGTDPVLRCDQWK